MELFAVGLALLFLIGAILGWVSLFQVRGLQRQITHLTIRLNLLSQKQESTQEPPSVSTEAPIPEQQPVSVTEYPKATNASHSKNEWTDSTNDVFSPWLNAFKENWMVYIGGLSVALAGIFLARYSIQHGLLGPTARIVAGIITGLALHVGAEYLRRKLGKLHLSFTMLAGGGSITLFGTILAALHYYQLFSPTLVFIALAVVAMATLWLSLIHGPILAAMGMLGAYVVPILVSTGSGNILIALLYSLIITGSILVLFQYVSRYWLWTGMLVGSLFWWGVSFDYSVAEGWRLLYLAALGYGVLCIPSRNWLLTSNQQLGSKDTVFSFNSSALAEPEKWLAVSLFVLVAAFVLSLLPTAFNDVSIWQWLPFAGLVLIAGNKNAYLTTHSWLCYLGILLSLLFHQVNIDSHIGLDYLPVAQVPDYLTSLVSAMLLFTLLAARNSLNSVHKNWWCSLTLLTPLLAMMLSYVITKPSLTNFFWTLYFIAFGAFYMFLASLAKSKAWHLMWSIWAFLAGHFAYSFAAVVYLQDGALTLALAIQAISVAFIIKRHQMPELGWLLKGIVTLTVIRLTINPWLADYPIDQHWTIWAYGGSLLSVYIASRMLDNFEQLKRWTMGASLHLLVLTLWVETRYYLYEGEVFQSTYSFTEAALTTLIFGSMALVYHYKIQFAQHMAILYEYYSKLLMLLTLINYAIIVMQTLDNDYWVWSTIGTTPIFNILLIAFGFPVIFALACVRFYHENYRRFFEYFAAFTAFVFINLEIRHLWQGNLNLSLATSDGEFYTYSVVWLLVAIGLVFAGSFKLGARYYKAGMLLLALVVAKVFILDMSQLDGIYRIIAFMGLGLSLLGMGYMHKKLELRLEQAEQSQ